ncbi:transporter substrate-binding domain-containing protein [Variovorax sp. LjRoot130]|uniref:transporter substrate-binding domain-containing protein n=1 Tax=Variovorax sp. LjRoot130 TaxID=3342261 RepID=UPI003ECE4C4A
MKKQLLAVALAAMTTACVFAQTDNTVAKVKSSGTITMGVRESSGALSYMIGDGKYAGFHVDVCQRVISNLERTLGTKVEVRYQAVTSQNRIPLVLNGTVDIECGSTTNNLARQKDVAFALTTYVEEVRVAVKADSGIDSLTQLAGKVIVTTTGTTSVQLLRKHNRTAELKFKDVLSGKDMADSFLLLESGRADAFVMDSQVLAGNIATSRSPADYRIVGEPISIEPIAIMLRKDDPAFKKVVDDSIRELIKTGELAKMYDRWFVQPIPPKNIKLNVPASAATRAAWADPNDKPLESYVCSPPSCVPPAPGR